VARSGRCRCLRNRERRLGVEPQQWGGSATGGGAGCVGSWSPPPPPLALQLVLTRPLYWPPAARSRQCSSAASAPGRRPARLRLRPHTPPL